MMLVTAILKPFALSEVREGLERLDISGMTVSEVSGYGRQRGHTEVYRGADYHVDFVPKVRVEVVVDDAAVERVIDRRRPGARAAVDWRRQVWVTPVDTMVGCAPGSGGPTRCELGGAGTPVRTRPT